MNDKRPVNLNLFTIKFPIPAIVSILHRISGVFLFLMLPLLMWALNYSLTSENHFEAIKSFFSSLSVRLLLWLSLTALGYHLIAGIRHLLMDMHIGEDLKTGRAMAKLTIVVSGFLAVILGVWLW